jgi:hypothetical protein
MEIGRRKLIAGSEIAVVSVFPPGGRALPVRVLRPHSALSQQSALRGDRGHLLLPCVRTAGHHVLEDRLLRRCYEYGLGVMLLKQISVGVQS